MVCATLFSAVFPRATRRAASDLQYDLPSLHDPDESADTVHLLAERFTELLKPVPALLADFAGFLKFVLHQVEHHVDLPIDVEQRVVRRNRVGAAADLCVGSANGRTGS